MYKVLLTCTPFQFNLLLKPFKLTTYRNCEYLRIHESSAISITLHVQKCMSPGRLDFSLFLFLPHIHANLSLWRRNIFFPKQVAHCVMYVKLVHFIGTESVHTSESFWTFLFFAPSIFISSTTSKKHVNQKAQNWR